MAFWKSLRTRRSEAPGAVRIAYETHERWAVWRPWLVLVHGVGFDRTGWEPVVRGLRRRFRLVLLDNRGIGSSAAAPAGYGVSAMAQDVVDVLDHARIRSAHVVGASLGGMVAQDLALPRPERVRRLVLVGTTPGFPSSRPVPVPTVALLAQTPLLPRDVAVRRHAENVLSPRTVAENPAVVERLVADRQASRQSLVSWLLQMTAGATYGTWTRHGEITAETLVVHGDADTVSDLRNGQLLARRISRARLVVVPDAGHLLFWEHPARFVALVTAFLRGRSLPPVADGAGGPVSRWQAYVVGLRRAIGRG